MARKKTPGQLLAEMFETQDWTDEKAAEFESASRQFFADNGVATEVKFEKGGKNEESGCVQPK